MRNPDSTQAIDYLFLTRWFVATGANRFRKKLLLLLLLTVLAAFSEGISLWLIVPVFRADIPAAGPSNSASRLAVYLDYLFPVTF